MFPDSAPWLRTTASGLPGWTHEGHLRCAISKADALVLRAFRGQVRVRRGCSGRRRCRCGSSRSRARRRASRRRSPARYPEALLLRPSSDVADQLRAERLLRGRALVGEHAHREHDEDRGDERDRPPQRPPLGAHVDERHREQQDQQDGRDPDRPEDDRRRPLEDPQQIEEEVEVPVGPRDEADGARVGRARRRASRASREAVLGVVDPASSTSRSTASAMITATTTSDMIVSWSIA